MRKTSFLVVWIRLNSFEFVWIRLNSFVNDRLIVNRSFRVNKLIKLITNWVTGIRFFVVDKNTLIEKDFYRKREGSFYYSFEKCSLKIFRLLRIEIGYNKAMRKVVENLFLFLCLTLKHKEWWKMFKIFFCLFCLKKPNSWLWNISEGGR